MATAVEQIEPDGSIVVDFDPPQVPFDEQEEIIRAALLARNWNVNFVSASKEAKRRKFIVKKNNISFQVVSYIFSNFSWSNGNRSHAEKRIQLSRDYTEHALDFDLSKDGDPRCVLMGIYRRKGQIIFGAWDAAAYKGHKNPSSCYVRTPAMASAMRSGFGQSLDGNGRLVCCFSPDMLAYYLENMEFLHERVVVNDKLIAPAPETEDEATSDKQQETDLELPNDVTQIPLDIPHNRIIYGAPGTGKSHKLEEDLKKYFPSDSLYERTTFYPDYTNGVFVGEYKPVPVYRRGAGALIAADRKTEQEDLEPIIDYKFVPGPFLRMLARARLNPNHNFALVIEEINRAHASAVFGEVFQMLDRDDKAEGKFSVTLSPDAQNYLASVGLMGSVRMPKNLYIWATMNSADQGVLPMDAAFRRRWSLEYVGIDDGENVVSDWEMTLRFVQGPVKWNDFRKKINRHLASHGVAEDRLLGPFFMSQNELLSDKAFENKLLQYLRDDVVRSAPNRLFRGGSLTYGALVADYRNGQSIFVDEVGLNGPA